MYFLMSCTAACIPLFYDRLYVTMFYLAQLSYRPIIQWTTVGNTALALCFSLGLPRCPVATALHGRITSLQHYKLFRPFNRFLKRSILR